MKKTLRTKTVQVSDLVNEVGRQMLVAETRANAFSSALSLVVYVIAGNYHQFQNWCRAQGLSERSGAARYVSDADQLRGVRVSQEQIVFTGNWAGRPDAELLRQMAEHACRP